MDKTSVVFQADGSEEMEALVVVPSADSTTRQLWGRTKPYIDVERATHVKVAVRRTPPSPSNPRPKLQVIRPTPERPVVKPIVKKGSELKPVFGYCPYPYYGKLSSFQKVLYQDSWQQWYRKQWASNAVQSKVLQASGATATQGLYNIAYARDGKRGIDLLAAGFDNLNPADLQKLLDHVDNLSQTIPTVQPPPDVLQRWDQARPLFDAISTDQLINWFTTLSQALQQNNFDQVYEQLLTQGLGQLEQAIMILNGTGDATTAKSSILEGVKGWSSLEARLMQLPQDVRDRIDQLIREAFAHLVRALIPDQLLYTYGQLSLALTGFLGKAIGAICGQFSPGCSEAMKYLLRNIEGKSPRDVITELFALWDDMIWGFQADAKAVEALSRALNTIINTFTWDGNALNYTTQLVAFLDWVRDWRSANRGSNDMFEQALGTLMVAGSSIRQGWTYYGLRADKGGVYGSSYDIWWAGVLYLSPDKLSPNNNGRGIIVVERGDNCTDCAAKANEIVSWIGRAVEMVPSIQGNLTNIDPNSIGVVTFAFTNPNAQGIDMVLQKLRTQYANSQVPIIVSWLENNIVHFECIGAGCGNLTWEEQEKIACNQQGAPAGCTDWGAPVPSEPNQPTPFTIGSPPPPVSYCAGKICVQGVRL